MSQFFNPAGSGGGGSPIMTLTGNSGGPVPPTANNINIVGGSGAQVVGTPGTSTLTINVVNDGFPWSDQAVSFNAAVQNGYFCTAALTVNLPSSGLVSGSTVIIYVDTASTVTIHAAAGQQIEISQSISSVGGTATSTAQGNIVTLVFRTSDATWHAISTAGTFITA